MLEHHVTHGLSGTPTYKTWDGMIQRCTNPNHEAYERYGGRGITVCDKWLSFDGFLADMGERPSRTTIDRIDNELGYAPGNCRWASSTIQGRNRRHVKLDEVCVMQIRWLCSDGGYKQEAVAQAFGVRQSCVSRVVHRVRWA